MFLNINLLLSIRSFSSAKYFKICHKSDPDLNGCIKDAIEQLRPMLAAGKSQYLVETFKYQWSIRGLLLTMTFFLQVCLSWKFHLVNLWSYLR